MTRRRSRLPVFLVAAVLAALAYACGGGGGNPSPAPQPTPQPTDAPSPEPTSTPAPTPTPTASPGPTPTPTAPGTPPAPQGPRWVVKWTEDFEQLALPAASWARDPVPADGRYADAGEYFTAQGISPPAAFRITQPFGADGWLTLESYTRDPATPFASVASVVADPAGGANKVLRIASPAHTDATIVRPSAALPSRYRISLRVGFADFGDGLPGLNGYDGGETGEPWTPGSAVGQNGFYWLTILDALPRPHNNVWIHHHRKVVVDSDNNLPVFTEIWNGSAFVSSGVRPIMLFALDGRGAVNDRTGPPFLSWSAGQWQPSGRIRAVDAYLPGEWYRLSIERADSTFTIELSGRFQFGGQRTYRAVIDAAASCVWHFNRPGEDGSRCAGPAWPADGSWPDWFMFGDPHANFYEGSVHYDDVRLEVWE
ncbi:MAG TPA: hypothetical protein VFK85_16245 [Anaeromyxobacteraceae bacterium]|nr:hypothetical protein [Anaeromyxobacteraceae bacterium]